MSAQTLAASARVRVRYAETDKMGVVYYSNYFVWFEVGRCELLRALGWSYRELESTGVSLPVIEASCRFARPGHYDDELEVRTRGRALSGVRLAFDYRVVRLTDDELLAEGRTLHAAIGADGRPRRLPDRIRNAFA